MAGAWLLIGCMTPQSPADTLYWDANGATAGSGVTPTGTWGTSAFWSTDSNGAVVTSAYIAGSDVVFSTGVTATGAYTITLSGTQLANSITFEDGAPTITGGTSLQIGAGGVNVTTLNASGATIASPTALQANQIWTIGANSSLTSSGVVSGNFSLTKGGSGTLTLKGANTFAGGLIITSGTVINSAAAGLGAGAVTLGDTSGSNDVNLIITTASTVANAINVASGSTGTFTLSSVSGGGSILESGAITLGHDLVVTNANSNITTLSGAISDTGGAHGLAVNAGTGTVALTAVGGSSTFSGGLVLNTGRLQVGNTNATGTGTFTIAGGSLDNYATSGTAVLNNSAYLWNADFTFNGSSSVTMGTGNVTLSGNRIVTTNVITNSVLAVSGGIGDGGNGYSLTKAGAGTLTLNGANTYSGATVLLRGTLNLTAATSTLLNTSGVTINGGVLNLGTTSGAGMANRINSAASLSLGGSGILSLNAGATGPVNSQSFVSLSVLAGSSQLSTTSVTNPGTFTFTGPSGSLYTRSANGTLRIVAAANTSFTNTPTGSSVSGSGANAILIGAVLGATATTTSITDFVKASSGAVSAATYVANGWSSGVNTDVTTVFSASGSTQSLRYNGSGTLTTTLTGVSTIESGGILVSSNALGGGIITGGTLQAASGQDLWIYASTLATSVQGLTIQSVIGDNGGSSLTKSGAGRLYLTNTANSFAGGTYLGEGILNISSGGALGAGGVTFTGNATLQAGSTNVDLGSRAITIAAGQTATFDTNGAGNTMTISGVISGPGGLTKTGLGTLVLTAANTYSGVTAIDNGILKLDFSAAGAPINDIISEDSLFSPGGASFIVNGAFSQRVIIQGKDAISNSQTFAGTYTNVSGNPNTWGMYLNRGTTHLDLAAGAGGTLTVNLGTVSRGFSTDPNVSLDITIGSGTTVLVNNANGLLGGYATVNGNTWANVTNGSLSGLATVAYSTDYNAANANLDVGAGGLLGANPYTLRFNNASAATVAPGAGVVRQIAGGGILVTSNVGANTSVISSGALTGISARDLIIHQNNTAGDLQIDATIVDTILRTMALSKDGAGKVVLTATNSYTGTTYVNEGTLAFTGDAVASFVRSATSASNSPTLTMSDTSGIFIGQSVTGANLTTSATTWTVVAINPNVSVTLSSNANVSSNNTFTFGAGGGLGAGATIHYIAPGATLQIGNGGLTGSLTSTQTVSDNGALILNRSNDFTFANVVSGTGTLEKQGAGNVTLGGANTFTGDTKISAGSLILSVATNLQYSTLDYNSYGGTLSFGTLAAATLGGLKGNQNLVLTNTGGAAVALTVGGSSGNLGTQQDTTYTGALSGLGGITKTGGSALTLSGVNTYAGSTNNTQGTLNLSGSFTNTGAISSSGGVMNLSGTFLDNGGLSVSGGITNLSGSFTRTSYNTVGALSVSGGVFNVTGTLGTSAAAPTAQTAFSGNSVTNFSGTEFLSGASTTFRVGEITSATVNVTGGSLTFGTNSGGVVLGRNSASASGFLNVTGGSVNFAGNTLLRIGAGFADTEASAASVLTISGTGLFNTSTTTGLFLLGSNLAGNTASTGTVNLDGGTLATLRSITGGTVGASFFNFNGGTFKATGTGATLAASLTTVNVRNGGAVVDSNGFNIAFAKGLTHSTILGDNASDGGLTKNGTGTLTLNGSSTYTGATVVNAGVLKAGVTTTGANGAFGNNSAVTLANASTAVLDLAGFSNTIGSLAGGGDSGGNVSLGTGTLTVGGNNTSTVYAGMIMDNNGGLVKVGTGTLALSGTNTYSGFTTVNGGNLQIGVGGAGVSGTGAVAVNGAGAVLSGTGFVQGAATVTLGQVRAGDNGGQAVGTLIFSDSLTFNPTTAGTVASLTIQGTNSSDEQNDRISIFGSLTLNAQSNIVVTADGGWIPTADQSWVLMDWSGLTLGGWSSGTNLRTGKDSDLNEGNLDLPDVSGYGLMWDIASLTDGSGGILSVSLTNAPEPARMLLALGGMACVMLRRRRAGHQPADAFTH